MDYKFPTVSFSWLTYESPAKLLFKLPVPLNSLRVETHAKAAVNFDFIQVIETSVVVTVVGLLLKPYLHCAVSKIKSLCYRVKECSFVRQTTLLPVDGLLA